MPNIASVLKSEIARLARKELRQEAEGLRKTISLHRSDIAALKRRVHDLERSLRASVRTAPSRDAEAERSDRGGEDVQFRFRASGMASNRKRLGLSAEDFGLLVGTSGQSIYAWESGRSKPRARYLAAIASLRGLGKRQVASKLAELKSQ